MRGVSQAQKSIIFVGVKNPLHVLWELRSSDSRVVDAGLFEHLIGSAFPDAGAATSRALVVLPVVLAENDASIATDEELADVVLHLAHLSSDVVE